MNEEQSTLKKIIFNRGLFYGSLIGFTIIVIVLLSVAHC